MRKSWRVFHDRSLLGRCFRGFILPVFEYCSAVWCSAADTHLKLLYRAVSGTRFLTGGVFECDMIIIDLWQFCVCCIKSGAQNGPYVRAQVTRGDLVAHRYAYARPGCRISQYRMTFLPLSLSFWNDHADPVFDGVGLSGFKSMANAFSLP